MGDPASQDSTRTISGQFRDNRSPIYIIIQCSKSKETRGSDTIINGLKIRMNGQYGIYLALSSRLFEKRDIFFPNPFRTSTDSTVYAPTDAPTWKSLGGVAE